MQKTSKVITICNGILLALSTGFQLLAIKGCFFVPDAPPMDEKYPWLLTGWILALSLLFAGYVSECVLKTAGKWPMLPLVVSLVGAFFALLVALTLKNAFPVTSGALVVQGLTFWRLCYRHLSSVLVGLLTATTALIHWIENRDRRIQEQNAAYHAIYSLSDEDSTIGLERFADEDDADSTPRRKQKRSLKKKAEKAKAGQ